MNKNFITLLVSCFALLLFANTVSAECACGTEKEAPRLISVSGTAKVTALPDKATVRFSIRNLNKVAEKARQENNEIAKDILNAVRAFGIPEKKIHLENLSIQQENEYNPKNGESTFKGYRAQRSFRVEIEKPDIAAKTLSEKIAEIVTAVVTNGSNQLESVSYGLINQDKLKNEALLLASKNAREKAEIVSKGLGTTIIRVHGFNENYSQPYYERAFSPKVALASAMDSSVMAAQDPDSYSEGELDVESNINAVFQIE